ncbi:Phosphorylated carbohydrates phosphatase [compost metagenome]
MTIEAVIFDMDGVLIDAREWHYDSLNRALELFGHTISRADHLSQFDGLPTKKKLEMLSTGSRFPRKLHGFVNRLKQSYTLEIVHTKCKPVYAQERALSSLKSKGYKLAVASNSVRASVEAMMDKSSLAKYLDLMMSNEDVAKSKPDPEIYTAAMRRLGVVPERTLIVEDNENGVRAARASGAHVLVVSGVAEVNLENICGAIAKAEGAGL